MLRNLFIAHSYLSTNHAILFHRTRDYTPMQNNIPTSYVIQRLLPDWKCGINSPLTSMKGHFLQHSTLQNSQFLHTGPFTVGHFIRTIVTLMNRQIFAGPSFRKMSKIVHTKELLANELHIFLRQFDIK